MGDQQLERPEQLLNVSPTKHEGRLCEAFGKSNLKLAARQESLVAASKRLLKALIIGDGLDVGGAEHQLYLLAKYLPIEWERQVWVIDGGPNLKAFRSAKTPFRMQPRKWKFDVSPAFDLWKLILDWRPDVVHAWGWMSCIAALPVCRVLRIPIINGTIRQGNIGERHWGQWLSLVTTDGIIANSRAGLRAWDISGRRSRVVYNGFDPTRPVLIRKAKKHDRFTVIMVARMEKEKDFCSFIDCARMVIQKGGSWRFLAIGSGSLRAELQEYARTLVKSGIMEFPEVGLEVLPVSAPADVGVLLTAPPFEEGCSNSIMEYMASQLPVVCSAGGGNPEIVLEGETGFLIQPGDPESLAERLTYLYDNRDEGRRMGEAGYARFLRMFSVERTANETAEFYSGFLTKT